MTVLNLINSILTYACTRSVYGNFMMYTLCSRARNFASQARSISCFQCVTLKRWEWRGDEASKAVHDHDSMQNSLCKEGTLLYMYTIFFAISIQKN